MEQQSNPFQALAEGTAFAILDLLEDDDSTDVKSFSLVCKLFHSIESRHRRILTLLGPEFLPRILRRYPHVTDLNLNICPRISQESIISISNTYRSTLRNIALRDCRSLTYKGLSNLVSNCSGLVQIDLSDGNSLTDYTASAIAGAKNLEDLNLANCKLITGYTFAHIAGMCRKLRRVCLEGCSLVTDFGVGILARNCKEIRCLDLSYLKVTKKCIPAIVQLQHLKKLNLAGCHGIDDEGLLILRESCKSLETLNVSYCKNVKQFGFSSPANGAVTSPQNSCVINNVDKFLQSYKVLQSIILDGCVVTSFGMKALGNWSASLKKLSLFDCVGVKDEGLSSIVQKHHELGKLNIGNCYNITNVSIDCLLKSCTSLTSLKMESCSLVSKEAYVLIGQRCPLLEKLVITDSTIDNEGMKSISRCSKLSTFYLGNCMSVTDDGLSFVGLGCPKLKCLSLRRCRRLTDVGIAAIAHGCPLLELLEIPYCEKLTDNSLISLSRCSRLKALYIQGCYRVSSEGLSAIAVGCRQLLMLNMKQCHIITDDGMLSLSQNSRNLIKINLEGCCAVTDVGLLALASSNINRLQDINMSVATGLTPNGVATTLLTCRALTEVKLDVSFKSSLHQSLIRNMEAQGVVFRWKKKSFRPPQLHVDESDEDMDELSDFDEE